MERMSIKPGETFHIDATYYTDDDVTVLGDLTGATITGEVRDGAGTLVTAIIATVDLDQVTNKGAHTLSIAGNTKVWPVGELYCDLFYSQAGVLFATETFGIHVNAAITRLA